MAQTVEEAQAAVEAAQKALDEAKKSGSVSDAVAASKALSAANRALAKAKAGGLTAAEVRQKAYFDAQAKAKEEAAKDLPPLPESDAYNYDYVWRQDVGTSGGQYKLVKTQNPFYDPDTNEITDPVTGNKTKVTPSMYGGTVDKNDPYMRDQYGNITYDSSGKPILRPGASLTDNKAGSGNGSYQNLPYTGGYQQQNLPYTTNQSGSANNPFQPGTDAYKSFEDKRSAWALLQDEFTRYGLGALVPTLQSLIQEGVAPAEFTLRLRESPAYQDRFKANSQRIAKGLTALTEAEYLQKEDAYQNVMRNYGLPESYYTRGYLGKQEGFEKLIANDVSASELEDRIQTAQNRIQYANPEVAIALKTFYPDITNGDILAYVLDPQTGLANIKRRITAAEIGGTAVAMGLATNVTDAEYLARYGVTKQQAQQGYQAIGSGLQRGSELASLYNQSPYTQATAEQEVFGVPGAAEAKKKRQDLASLERATFSGQTGAGGALARERAGGF